MLSSRVFIIIVFVNILINDVILGESRKSADVKLVLLRQMCAELGICVSRSKIQKCGKEVTQSSPERSLGREPGTKFIRNRSLKGKNHRKKWAQQKYSDQLFTQTDRNMKVLTFPVLAVLNVVLRQHF